MGIEESLSADGREKLRDELLAANDRFVLEIPKVELHMHIEGTLTAELRWKFAQRNGIKLRIAEHGPELNSLEEAKAAMDLLRPDPSRVNNDEERFQFFEAYYEGFECLKTREDYYDLAMHYLEHAAKMNVRYCELFFDPQGHTSRGTSWAVMMEGFREAQKTAETRLNVRVLLGLSDRAASPKLIVGNRLNRRGSCASYETCLWTRPWNITRPHSRIETSSSGSG